MSYEAQAYWDQVAKEIRKYARDWKEGGFIGARNCFTEYEKHMTKQLLFQNIRINENMKVLDVGCGVGRWSFQFAKMKALVIGVDISKEMITIATDRARKMNLTNAQFIVMDGSGMRFPDNSFDLVNSVAVLQHIIDAKVWKKVIREITRVARKGGTIVILEHAPNHLRIWPRGGDLFVRTFDEYVKEFEIAGAKLIKWRGLNPSNPILRIGRLLLHGYAYFIEKKRLDFYSANSSDYFPPMLYMPCKIIIKLAKLIDLYLGKYPRVERRASYKLMIFQKV